jgi:RNA exonuclease 1
MPASKKYKLLRASDGSKPACAFFSSPDGCRNGDKCAFLHGPPGAVSAAEVSETASVISSEESDAGKIAEPKKASMVTNDNCEHNPFVLGAELAGPQVKEQKKPKKRKSISTIKGGDDLFAKPKEKETQFPEKKKVKISDSPRLVSSQRTQTKKDEVISSPVGREDFRSLTSKLPVASFAVPGVASAKKVPDEPTNRQQKGGSEHENTAVTHNIPESILPTSTEQGRKWLKAVQGCRKHERYLGAFDFTRYKEISKEVGVTAEWIKARPFGDWCATNPQAVAIDCEMCETQDPLSGAKNPKALCRLSVVNAENPDDVLLDTLVKPAWPVTDYRTRINGITKEDLASVEFTLRHAQAFMMALCSNQTVIVGHAVQNDLAALFMEHYCVADSSFLFFAKDSTTSSVSLKDLVASIFKIEMPDTHDSVNDARKALECVLHWVERDGDVDSIERTAKHNGHQLFVHRIPKQCKIHHLTGMFVKHTSIEPSSVDEIEFSGEAGKTHVTFRSARHASLAFDTLEGTADSDASGRLQKKVYLRNGDYVRVRKMIHNHRAGTQTKATPGKK